MQSSRRRVLTQPLPARVVDDAATTHGLRRRRRPRHTAHNTATTAVAADSATGNVPQQHVEHGVARVAVVGAAAAPSPPQQQQQTRVQRALITAQTRRDDDDDDVARLFAPRPPPQPPVVASRRSAPSHTATAVAPVVAIDSASARSAQDSSSSSNKTNSVSSHADAKAMAALPLPMSSTSLLVDMLDVSSPSVTGTTMTTMTSGSSSNNTVSDAAHTTTTTTTTQQQKSRTTCKTRQARPSSTTTTLTRSGRPSLSQTTVATTASVSSQHRCRYCQADVSADRAAATRRRIAQLLTAAHTPRVLHRVLLETIDFFTHVRVYVVLLLVLALLLFAVHRGGVLDDVAATFVVADDNRPGLSFWARYQHGNRTFPRKHPVLIIPGFITAALEVWQGELPCLREQAMLTNAFRQHMFGPQMLFLILRNPQCWLDLFSLDRVTGLDRDGARVRADSGFASVDFFVAGYWVWAKILINLADVGYDPQSMAVITHDWRLAPRAMHERDGLFYQIRNTLQFLTQKNGERAVVISHSYGVSVALAFFRWAEAHERGFVDRHVAYYVNIGGTTMGLPKSVSALLLGDVRDTIAIPRAARTVLDTFISQSARYNTTRTWSSLFAMLPRGCAALTPELLRLGNGTVLPLPRVLALLEAECVRTGHVACARAVRAHRDTVAHTLPSLPHAPHTTAVCLYGVNKPAEVGYVLEHTAANNTPAAAASAATKTTNESMTGAADEAEASASMWPYLGELLTNTSYTDKDTVRGVRLSDGDGTVPLLSLGYMCRAANGWRRDVGRVVTMEFRHDERAMSPLNLRGSSVSGDHVDILGNFELIDTILKLASGVSELDDVAADDDVDDVDADTAGEADGRTRQRTDGDDTHQQEDNNDRGVDNDKDDADATRRRWRRVVQRRQATAARRRGHRVRDRIYSDIDRLIATQAAECLTQPRDDEEHNNNDSKVETANMTATPQHG